MPEGLALEFSGVTKRFGAITAVSDFSARVEPGQVTGFLGPNGAGKTTSLRILLGLVRATEGTATIGGLPYAKLDRPLQTVGAVLEASSFHPGRTAANHLAVYADAAGIPRSRVDDVLGLVGLGDSAGRKVGGFSLGMRQRLGLAYALLGDPGILVLDEPANGLDPEGIKWMRGFLRQLAREGRTVLTSSHLLAEVQQTVDSLLVISHGRLVFQGGLDELTDPSEYATVVDSPDRDSLVAAMTDAGVAFEVLRSGLTVRGLEPADVGGIAAAAGVALSSLQRRGPALEEVFLDLVNGTRVHPSAPGAATAGPAVAGAAVTIAEVADARPQAVEDEPNVVELEPDHVEPAVVAAAVGGAAFAADDETDAADQRDAAETSAESDVIETAPDAPEAPAAAAFVVASTGVIDVVSLDEDVTEPETEPEPATEESIPFETVETVAAPAAAALADEDEVARDDAVDVEVLSVEDDDLAETLPADSSESERPWEEYVKTESDLEADAFFASFDAEQAAAAAAAQAENGREPEGGAEPEPAVSADAESEPAQTAEPAAEPDPEPDPEPEPEHEPEHESESDPEPDPASKTEPDPPSEASGSEASGDEPSDDTNEFGALSDLSSEWVEDEHHGGSEDEGEQR